MNSIEDAATLRLLARELSRKPLPLATNKIAYVIAGGSLLPRFLGEKAGIEAPNPPSQMWVASTVTSALGEATEGLSRVADEDGGCYLKALLDSAPELFLGAAHARKWGANPGYLIKLLNSRDRLLVQVHPDKEKARRYFDSDFGKTEAWFVVNAEKSAFAYAGFKPGVTKELLRAAILGQDSEKILGLLHAFPIIPGDIMFIPAGLPHALGKDSLVLEIQEPTDITLRAERRRPSGEVLPESYLHAGRGMDVLLECFDYRCRDFESARAEIFLRPETIFSDSACVEQSVISRATTDCFAMNSISLAAGASRERRNEGFVVGLVLSGTGFARAGDREIPLWQGKEIFLPHGVERYSYKAENAMKIMECYPPSADGVSGGNR